MPDIRAALAGAGSPLIVAHRGDHSDAPENSCAAIRAAQVFDMVEIDVRISADGVPVVIHDATLNRTAGRQGTVSELMATELSAVTLEGTTETLPLLATALDAGGGELLFDIDVKDPAELSDVAAVLSRHPARQRFMLKADVASIADIDRLLELQDRSEVTVIAKTILEQSDQLGLIRAMHEAQVAAVELWFPDVPLLKDAVSVGVPVTTYTLPDVFCAGLDDARALQNPASVWGVLADAGVRAIMTDAPRAAKDFFA